MKTDKLTPTQLVFANELLRTEAWTGPKRFDKFTDDDWPRFTAWLRCDDGTLSGDDHLHCVAMADRLDEGAPQTRKTAIVSTFHMTPDDDARLNQSRLGACTLVHARTRFGYVLVLPLAEDERPGWCSELLWANLVRLRRQGWERVELDRDGPTVTGLAVSPDWEG